ncbi:hypothetical protein [Aureliella helgolandensis]|uniref:F0F1-ATPase subunit (ATPase_gene1) n=1 Tax=Aureliella helgolandensis TaxID=2527968 RepID=A0A518GEA5_9BACT|nr:hypothetical protein [Aureliella helgolandensis]QDV26878.1 Putative F0F1-ATPase subunit (ATPase_gene1) [Aureliella helgolandensis]
MTNPKSKADRLFEQSTQWLSRTIAVVILMLAPGLAGRYLDERLQTTWLTPAGFGIGIALATIFLLTLASKLIPAAGGTALPPDPPAAPDLDEWPQPGEPRRPSDSGDSGDSGDGSDGSDGSDGC